MEIRAITPDEMGLLRGAMVTTFGLDPAGDPQGDDRCRALVAPGRALAAFDKGVVVGTAATFDFELSVPGGTVPMAGLTMVSVRPTHRRRGILRELMARHLQQAHSHGQPVSGLWASEATIYGRFGYGVAAEGEEITLAPRGAKMRATHLYDQMETVTDDEAALPALKAVYDSVHTSRPGTFSRSDAWWRWRRLSERPDLRAGLSLRRHAIARRGDLPTGYIAYRQGLAYEDGLPAGKCAIDEIVAVDAQAEATLWRFATNVDLFPNVSWWNAPVDSLIPWLLEDRRHAKRRRFDTLWLQPLDIPRCLEARSYAADGCVRLAVETQTHELTIESGNARCRLSNEQPEVAMNRATLGSLYLGGVSAVQLARAGQVHGEAQAIARTERMFRSDTAPWCGEIF